MEKEEGDAGSAEEKRGGGGEEMEKTEMAVGAAAIGKSGRLTFFCRAIHVVHHWKENCTDVSECSAFWW